MFECLNDRFPLSAKHGDRSGVESCIFLFGFISLNSLLIEETYIMYIFQMTVVSNKEYLQKNLISALKDRLLILVTYYHNT